MIDYNKLITETQINIASNFRESHGSQPKVSEYKKEKKPKDFPKVGDTIKLVKQEKNLEIFTNDVSVQKLEIKNSYPELYLACGLYGNTTIEIVQVNLI